MTSEKRVRRLTAPGQSMTEFALVLLVFLLFALGIIDFGRAILAYNVLDNAAREGARVGIVPTNTLAQMCQQVLSVSTVTDVNSSASCAASGDPAVTNAGAASPSDYVIQINRGIGASSTTPNDQVVLTYKFKPITPLIDAAIGITSGGTFALSASSSMYVEGSTVLTATPLPTNTPFPTDTPAPSNTGTPTDTPVNTSTPTITSTITPTATATTCTGQGNKTCTPTVGPTHTPTITATATATGTPTLSPTRTATPTITNTPTTTNTPTITSTPSKTSTPTPTCTPPAHGHSSC
jgi:Flp pilus assembly protein TadG